jgi:simple sugar transport system ATP-binding protein
VQPGGRATGVPAAAADSEGHPHALAIPHASGGTAMSASEPTTTPAPAADARPDAIRAEHLSKRFGPVEALSDITMRVAPGEVLGLIGDNGAGKSTLIKIITGFHQPDSGTIWLNGEEVRLRSVSHARSLGIETVYQDLALIPELSVYHNMFLKRERLRLPLPFLHNGAMRRQARAYLDDMGVRVQSVDTEVGRLSGGQRQAIAIARAVYSQAKILLLDEPLAAMGAKEGALILDLVRNLKERGEVSMILIAHNYAQVLDVCDRVNLLRHGRIFMDKRTSETSLEELTEVMVEEYRRPRRAT